jgi:hypothetical protein
MIPAGEQASETKGNLGKRTHHFVTTNFRVHVPSGVTSARRARDLVRLADVWMG